MPISHTHIQRYVTSPVEATRCTHRAFPTSPQNDSAWPAKPPAMTTRQS